MMRKVSVNRILIYCLLFICGIELSENCFKNILFLILIIIAGEKYNMASNFTTKMNLANFTCKFGEKYVMLDLFEQVVFPAFMENRIRTFGDASYSFLDQQIAKFDDDEVCLCGRLVKDTIVERSQIMVDGKIVEDHKSMESAPTSFFVLLLSNHKLLYVRESPGAPSLSSFTSTISLFLGDAYKEWIRTVYDNKKNNNKKITWKALYSQIPPPKVTVTPMSSEDSVSAFIEKFKAVNAIEVRVLETNHELDNSPIFGEMREIKELIGADNMLLRSQKSGAVGLDKANLAKLISSQAGDGNTEVTIKGTAINGEKITAKDDSFSIAIVISKLPKNVLSAAGKVYEKLKNQLSLGIVSIKPSGSAAISKVGSIIKARTWG